jgi:DNA repair exonuclease SbcCD nuclease subunit
VVRLIHSADWQIGMTRHFLSPEAQSRYSEARLESIRRIGALASTEACDFVVVAGDVFESNQLDRHVAARALDAVAGYTVPLFLLPGNHDPLLSAGSIWDSPTFLARCPEHVVVLRDRTPVAVPGCDAEVVGAVWHSKQPTVDLVGDAVTPLGPPSGVRVLVGHGAVDKESPDLGNPALISLDGAERAVRDGRLQYVALGDRHSRTEVGGTGRIWYSGTPLATDYDEISPNEVLLVELDGDRIVVEPRTAGEWRFIHHRFELADDGEIDEVARWFAALEDRRRAVVKLTLVGTISLAGKARLDALVDEQRDLLGALEIWDRRTDLAVLPDGGEFADLGLGGFVAATVEELIDIARAGSESGATAQDALSLLYRLAGACR